ncbi:MAG: extracellular solute-binding protein [Kosmotoga sp.]|uniref:extracellular solute-binding protein n=1 Tax=Kosmotoga sp. TaxID=1955248 RepID=UPI001DD4797E|nr:extracellular solute-binding protein [Kosmotoga sp.]MBO8165782.1 extracellular solute-binding protein [Kosmotoga sp.]
MFKKQVLLLGIITLIGIFACAAPLVTSTHIGSHDAPISITWLALPHYSLQNPYENRQEYLEEAFERWVRKNPDVQVNLQILSGSIGQAMAKLLTQAKSHVAPDVAQIDSFYLPRFYDVLQPLDEFFTEDEVDDFLPYVEEGIKDSSGHVKALWFTTDVRVLYYRKDLIKNPPKTWDEVLTLGKNLKKEHPDMDIFLYPAGKGEATMICLMPLFWAQGGQLVDSKGRPVFNKGKNHEYMLNLLNFLQETVETGITPKRVTSYQGESDINQDVAAENVAMFIGGNWQISQIKDLLGEEGLKNWDIALLPQKKGNLASTGVGGWTWGIFTSDPVKKAAIVRMLNDVYVGSAGMYGWCSTAGYMPTRRSVYEDYAFYATNPWMQKFLAVMEKGGRPRPGFEIYPTISNELQIAISSVISGIASPEKALETAWNNVMQEYEK